jgi:CubicO group peptidase (beta-lactamase class C family)
MFVWIEGRTSMRRTTLTIAALALGMVLAGTGGARGQPHASGMSPERLERVTAVLDKYIDAGALAGAVSLIYRHGEIAHLSARGFQDADARTPMQRDTIFGLASMTKPITAVATMMLVEEGKIRLDEPVDRWLPELADRQVLNDPVGPLDDVHDSPRPTTVRDLLKYTMGIGVVGFAGIAPDAPIAVAFAAQRGRRETPPDEYLERLGALPPGVPTR